VLGWMFRSRSWFAWLVCVGIAGVPAFYAYRLWRREDLGDAILLAIVAVALVGAKALVDLVAARKPQQT
jgi:hypothetical protein